MMYESKMVIAVKAKGQVLRESKSGENQTVFIPFGSEYSLLIKNLNSVKALVKVWIDGTDVTEGTSGLIVPPNQEVDLERFIKNGNLSAGNKFKFIERTAAVSNHRGNKIDDGLIRVEFEYERRAPVYEPSVFRSVGDRISKGGSLRTRGIADTMLSSSTCDWYSSETVTTTASVAQNATGITAAGSLSDQHFSVGAWFPTDGVKHVMVLQMLGELGGMAIEKPVTVKAKPTCSSCGKVNKANAKFCVECGTSLQIV